MTVDGNASRAPGPTPGWDLLSDVFADQVISTIFGEEATIAAWLEVERALARAEASVGVLSEEQASAVCAAAVIEGIDRARLWQQTRNVGYPIFPLVRMIAAGASAAGAGNVHLGATTQDVMDTALVLQLRRGLERLEQLVVQLGDRLVALVDEHEQTVVAARTHGQQAVPTTLGAKLASLLGELSRHRERLGELRRRLLTVSLYGAGGTSAALGPQAAAIRAAMATELTLACDDVPWHAARDRFAEYGSLCSMLAATCARLAREVIELSRTEIGELAEAPGHHRGASSTMPQKANPIASEVVVGMAGAAQALTAALPGMMQPVHERAAGEWQTEWFVLPALSRLAGGALFWAVEIASGLRVFPEAMARNLSLDGGLLLSEAYMIGLARHIGRERAHDLTYQAVTEARASGRRLLDVLCDLAAPDVADTLAMFGDGLVAEDYLGEAAAACKAAVRAWRQLASGS